jgi:putative SOS response-associated peptidase YedK
MFRGMCGRFTLATPASEWAALFRLDEIPDVEPRFNIAPTQDVMVVRAPSGLRERPGLHLAPSGSPVPREAATMRWGLIPRWAREIGSGQPLINARSETVAEKPSFRDSYRERRCLVVADGFYEWQAAGRHKQPYWIGIAGGQPFGFAGLWDRWKAEDGHTVDSCTILTTDANESLRPLHDRMPVIVAPEQFDMWMDPDTIPWELEPLLIPYPADDMEFYPVTTRVNYVANDDALCMEPMRTQTELF